MQRAGIDRSIMRLRVLLSVHVLDRVGVPSALVLLCIALLACSPTSTAPRQQATAAPLLPSGAKSGQAPSLPPGGHIVFVSNRDGAPEIYVMNANGSEPKRLTNGQGDESWPSFSPDGKQILYENTVGGTPHIFVMNADGSQAKNLTPSGASDEFPSWSPDGMHIAFTSDRDGHVGIYAMNNDGSGVRHVMDDPSNDWFPVWSPDGRSIAFISDRDGSSGNIFVMDSNGNQLVQVTTGTSLAAKPSWAPDSQRLAVFTGGGFFAVSRAGGDATPIVSDGEDPAWSPDGNWIAFASRRDAGRLQLYLTAPGTSSVQRITKSSAEDWEPSWGP